MEPESLDGIVITHEHGDHTRGMGVFSRRHDVPLYVTDRTRAACRKRLRGTERVISYRPGDRFRVGAVRVESFLTVHDAADPVGVTLVDTATGARVGIATDLGRPTAQVYHALSDCDFLVLEANHDEGMLRAGPYPWSVQARIASSHGHLSNHAAAQVARRLHHPRLAGILLAHLSDSCNAPDLARTTVETALRRAGYRGYLDVAPQDEPTDLLDIEELRAQAGPIQYTLL